MLVVTLININIIQLDFFLLCFVLILRKRMVLSFSEDIVTSLLWQNSYIRFLGKELFFTKKKKCLEKNLLISSSNQIWPEISWGLLVFLDVSLGVLREMVAPARIPDNTFIWPNQHFIWCNQSPSMLVFS